MKIFFTRHAKSRMRERRISKENVVEVMRSPQPQEIIGQDRYQFYRHFGKRFIRVTCQFEKGIFVIITAVDKNS